VTQLHGVVYIVCLESLGSSAIIRFDAVTHQRLADIALKGLSQPFDIAACEHTSSVYVADSDMYKAVYDIDYREGVWRVSSDGEDVQPWQQWSRSNRFSPHSLSVTSSRLLVTSRDTKQLRQFDAVGVELRRVDLPDYVTPQHAVESPTGTFIVCHRDAQLQQYQVSEFNTGGQVLRQFNGSRLLPLGTTEHIAADSQGNILVTDCDNSRILLLNSELALRRVIIDEHQLNHKWPLRLCYTEKSGQLLVAFDGGIDVVVFDVRRR